MTPEFSSLGASRPEPSVDSLPMTIAALLTWQKAECERQHARAEAAQAQVAELQKFVEAVQYEASDIEKPVIKFTGDPVEFYREMAARIVADRDRKKHELRKALEKVEAALARCTEQTRQIQKALDRLAAVAFVVERDGALVVVRHSDAMHELLFLKAALLPPSGGAAQQQRDFPKNRILKQGEIPKY